MKHYTGPQVYMLAKTSCLYDGVAGFLEASGVEAYTDKALDMISPEQGEGLIELAGRSCYKSFEPRLNPNVTKVREGRDRYIGNILKQRHGSVLEHATVTFGLVKVSRVFTHELVRHRAGMAFSQESLRFVRFDDIPFWVPPSLDDDGGPIEQRVTDILTTTERMYKELIDVLNVEGMESFAEKKAITSALRRLVPDGVSTSIVVTGNHRAWRHIIEQRCSGHAEEEIHLVISRIATLLKGEFPNLYQDMTINPDGTCTFEHSKV